MFKSQDRNCIRYLVHCHRCNQSYSQDYKGLSNYEMGRLDLYLRVRGPHCCGGCGSVDISVKAIIVLK